MEDLCRLCGSESGIKVDIFEPGAERVRKIHKILPITVSEYDPFPKKICHHCSYKVDQFFEFRTASIRAQERFKKQVPWLRDKQRAWKNEGEQPMVEVTLNSVNAVSPNEKQISSSNRSWNGSSNGVYMEDDFIVIDDSPPYIDHSNEANDLVSECDPIGETMSDDQQNATEVCKPKKSRSRSLWDTKKRKRKNRKSFKVTEVYTTTEKEYENFNNIENDPLRLSPVDNIENNSFDNIVENNSCVVKSPKNELSVVEKGILTDDTGGVNIVLPKSILITKIPRVGNVYTCERCGRTFLNPQPASLHTCCKDLSAVEDDRPKEEPQHPHEVVETDEAKDFYQCNDCGHVFTRHSQLISHRKKHNNPLQEVESSSDDSFKPFNKRKKHHTKRKPKPRLLNPNNFNSSSTFETSRPNYYFDLDAVETNITRHSLLSSDSE